MPDLTDPAVVSTGGIGLWIATVMLFVRAILRGDLVPKKTHDDVVHQRDFAWGLVEKQRQTIAASNTEVAGLATDLTRVAKPADFSEPGE